MHGGLIGGRGQNVTPRFGADVAASEQDRMTREFYYLNLLSLFGNHLAVEEIDQLANAAADGRILEQSQFDQRLSLMLERFRASRLDCSNDEPAVPAPVLSGWTNEQVMLISTLRNRYKGLLVGLFHFGAHRHVVLDLAALGLPLSVPIAGRAYWDYYKLREEAPREFAACLKLMEVEKPSVGRELLMDIRRGRIGAIYADGNMGPDGHHVEEGATSIDFFGRQIRVKAGIARLSSALGVPILPVFATSSAHPERAQVIVGQPLLPQQYASAADAGRLKEAHLQEMMSTLYQQLEARIRAAPAEWEYAFCLHRWAGEPVSDDCHTSVDRQAGARFDAGGIARINSQRVASLDYEGEITWVDAHRQQGYRLPPWFNDCVAMLQSEKGVSRDSSLAVSTGAVPDPRVLELLHELIRKDLLIVDATN